VSAEEVTTRPVGFDAAPEQIKILVLTGALRHPSHTLALAEAVAAALAVRGIAVAHWSLREGPLPFADPEYHDDPTLHHDPVVRRLVGLADEADGFVLGSPVYHNSYSGVLKNALDSLAIAQFLYKPIALVSHGGLRDKQAVDDLRIVARGLLGVAIPTQICTRDADYETAEEGYRLTAPDILQRVERLTAELVLFAQMFRLSRQVAIRR
jgi:azobenzene reductase